MGDRGNVVLEFTSRKNPRPDQKSPLDSRIFFYTHYGGTDLPNTLRNALSRGQSRWGDDSYLARIIFSEMIAEGDDLKSLTGLGISPFITDNEHDLLVVNLPDQEIFTAKEESPDRLNRVGSFKEFAQGLEITI